MLRSRCSPCLRGEQDSHAPLARTGNDPRRRARLRARAARPLRRRVGPQGDLSPGCARGSRRDGSLRSLRAGEMERRGARPRRLCACARRGRGRRRRDLHHSLGAEPRLRHRRRFRQRRPEAGLARAARERQDARLLLPHRAARRLGRERDPHGRPPRRRSLGAGRREAVHHQRQTRGRGDRVRGFGQGSGQERHQRVHRSDCHAGLRGRARRREARPARLRHGADRLRELPHPRGQPARRRGRGLPDRAFEPRSARHSEDRSSSIRP